MNNPNKEVIINTDQFHKDGYLVVKNVFSEEEIKTFREEAYKQFEIDKTKGLTYTLPFWKVNANFVNGDLLSKDILNHILLDERILKIAKTILDSEKLVYFGDSSYQIGTGSNGFHRDNIDRTNLDGPDWKGKYTLIRVGLYLQDHKNYSGGLKIRKGSHKNRSGEALFVNNEVGDVVVWDLKTLHSGNAVRLKSMPNFSINNALIEKSIPEFLRKQKSEERISLFMTFALKSSHLDRYINEYTLKREDTKTHAKASVYDDKVLATAKSKNVEVIQPLS
ncbi:MAG: phytanoyl-CoA dioxygenase family protein [Bacteroidia bacterium]|nr:phytanoyl-CoA dioxygenase family protein [Bacteroidia bacterium]